MAKGQPIKELVEFRKARGLTMDQAASLVVVDGKPSNKASWCEWENGKKIPKPGAMLELERLIGVQPNAFYPRPDGGASLPAQLALGLLGGTPCRESLPA